MSPRSAELLARAREGAASARTLVEAGHAAYYAMLYAARAALSERDRHARSHSGIWGLFREEFVVTGQFSAIGLHVRTSTPGMHAQATERMRSVDDVVQV